MKEFDLLEKIFDFVRIVDPEEKTIMNISDEEALITVHKYPCYKIWEGNKTCQNCISLKAATQSETIVKFEHIEEKVYLVIATPYDCGIYKYAIEMIKDVSNYGLFESFSQVGKIDYQTVIKNFNTDTITDE